MRTSRDVTCVYLDRGCGEEDFELYGELVRLLTPTTAEIVKKYPRLLDFKQCLREELRDQGSGGI